ncbi:hypothetical protein BGX24_007865 [Mortierella sp. AD032]|nr:hypothetical protein BGX24_007865 [Mortierella sp. AD032]
MSDSIDDWEQADEVEIQAPVAAPGVTPTKNKIAILARPSSGSPGSPASPGPTAPGAGGQGGQGFGRGGGVGRGGGAPMILKRNPAGSAGSPNRQESPYGSSNSYNNNSYSNSSRQQQQQGYGQRDEEMDDLGDYIRILRRPQTPVQQARVSNQAKSKPLAQREADYNAAREKIFGPSPTPSSPIRIWE